MNKGIAIWNYRHGASDEQNTLFFHEQGFDAVSWLGSAFDALSEYDADRLAELLNKTSMRFSIHHKLPDPNNAEECARFPSAMRKIANWQRKYALLSGLTFDFWYPHDLILPYFGLAARELRGLGAFIACEDTPLNARVLEKFTAHIMPEDDFGILIDLGHMNIRHSMMEISVLDEYIKAFRALPVELKEIHVSDNMGRKDEHRDIGYGTLPVDWIAAALNDIRFDGIVTTEIICQKEWTLDEHRKRATASAERIMGAINRKE